MRLQKSSSDSAHCRTISLVIEEEYGRVFLFVSNCIVVADAVSTDDKELIGPLGQAGNHLEFCNPLIQ
jgi:hypothetical protein